MNLLVGAILLSGCLSGCTTNEIITHDPKIIKTQAEEAYTKQKYDKAGELYFRLWCIDPVNSSDELLKAVNAYLSADRYKEVLDLVEDLIIMRGENYNNYEPLLIKTLAYYKQVYSSETDINNAINALTNLKTYKHLSGENNKELEDMEKYLKYIITYHKLKKAYQAYYNNPPSLIAAMQEAKSIIIENPNTTFSKTAEEIYTSSAKRLNLID